MASRGAGERESLSLLLDVFHIQCTGSEICSKYTEDPTCDIFHTVFARGPDTFTPWTPWTPAYLPAYILDTQFPTLPTFPTFPAFT